MTAEKYVNEIIKKIKCSKKQRQEIRQQLLSDISAELENGESLENVMERMGTPREAAGEFNLNLPVSERKKYSRNIVLKVIIGAAVIIIAAICVIYWLLPKGAQIGSSGVFEQSVVEEQVKWVVRELDANDFDSLNANAVEDLRNVLEQDMIESARSQISDDWGEFQSYGTIYMSEVRQKGQLFALAQVTVSYENTVVTYTISFDEDMKLAGLFMK